MRWPLCRFPWQVISGVSLTETLHVKLQLWQYLKNDLSEECCIEWPSAFSRCGWVALDTVECTDNLFLNNTRPICTDCKAFSFFRFGSLIWRSSKERKKVNKAARNAKCNSGDSGIQIEVILYTDTTHTDTSQQFSRFRCDHRANSFTRS